MNKAYSNKALPMGTVLREWRIEEVLGVGGFGIVYKARGIYFNELVAIKEYFPSSISERDSDDTVVPIDSDAEEVHALGLKKFVEEAKLLWNLSTPSRHPNIVSVRSLFEIHGTAYMVMDFEDGVSLSKMIKQGRRFNERSLWSILRPIAEGLERAHRVGVLHRDIKPPNILINEDNCPVLIDFGSARFEAAEATSTKVTFHTPPYAAIEQYVKTYPQGPWTDIYALGVVMYECVTGEKPPEVLERLHAGLGKPLAAGKWPGYGKKFLAAIDDAMKVKPDERPQSLSDWIAMFGKRPDAPTDEADDDATRFYAQQVEADAIVPVPPTPDLDPKAPVDTGVPDNPKEARFKRAGEETGAKRRRAAKPVETPAEEPAAAALEDTQSRRRAVAGSAEPHHPRRRGRGRSREHAHVTGKKSRTALIAGIAAVVVLGGGATALMLRGGSHPNELSQNLQTTPDNSAAAVASLDAGLAPAAQNAGIGDANAATPDTPQPPQPGESDSALKAERAKAAAAEAQLAAIRKAQAKAASQAANGVTAASKKLDKKAAAAASQASSAIESEGLSSAKLAQFNATVDEARSMARDAMHTSNSQNKQLAKNYDQYLKTLKASIRGVKSDSEADKLIKQANQTKAYIQFLLRQPQ